MNRAPLSHPAPRLAPPSRVLVVDDCPAERRASIVTLTGRQEGMAGLVLASGERCGVAARPEILRAAKRAAEDASR